MVIAPPAPATLPVRGTAARFPVHRIYCVGRNYAAHAIEMGHDPDREPPFFFMKSPTCLLTDGADMPWPPGTEDVHHEIELVVALGKGGRDIPVADALAHVWGYGVGLDMTRRDLQAALKKAGRPWEVAKAFEASAPCAEIVPAERIGHPAHGAIRLHVNGALRQEGDLDQMIWKVPEIIAHLSALFELRAGDLIMTGTPAGVGPVRPGDVMEAEVAGIGRLRTAVA
ncbi:fumarylacetoacetate hydrolase family protein [Rhodobaculum claviforme]|uniref:5-carboxymethyl-2-hydroxymuconate isomerase n=1 Tax=Rhodobaculum claviforme TaxID=1549854 RepID=A0A934TK49_9RHOB|nr:fumarylacetoacetate hydrolase family protein [Rhodobaculum claviforme]MBK5927006.1 5-carboxymethyl-2-hydroxymuconate isomerase [Rhodobaculum claviforme]